jgi:hypothetical protein
VSLLQITLGLLLSVLAGYVGGRWKPVSGFSRLTKRLNDLEVMIADLDSNFASLMESHKRLRSRAGMRELRERDSGKPETKAEVRARIFGQKSGPDFARRQLES